MNNPYGTAVRMSKFAVVGLSGLVVNSGILWILTHFFHIDYRIASLLAIEVAILNNYVWNTVWTWRDRPADSVGHVLRRFVKFNGASALVALINWLSLIALTEWFHIEMMISNLIGIFAASIFNFLVSHYWTFGTKEKKLPIRGDSHVL